MATPSINIGIGKNAAEIVQCIDNHFSIHEPQLFQQIVSSSVLEKSNDKEFYIIDKGEFNAIKIDSVATWIRDILYPEINNLISVNDGITDHQTIFNIVFEVGDLNTNKTLSEILASIENLKKSKEIGLVGIKLFVKLNSNKTDKNSKTPNIPSFLEECLATFKKYDNCIQEIYFIDKQNIDKMHLDMDSLSLGFALSEFFVHQMIGQKSAPISRDKYKIFGVGVIHFNEELFRHIVTNQVLSYKFEEEGISEEYGVQQQQIYNSCNPFIKNNQNYFDNFLQNYPFSTQNDLQADTNAKKYTDSLNNDLNEFISDDQFKLNESKAILANLIGEDDDQLAGVKWQGDRLMLSDLEFDIINYFNKYLEEEDRVDLELEKTLRESLTDLKNGIKKDKKLLEKIKKKSNEIYDDLEISFEEGIFSVDGKRINASGYIPSSPGQEFDYFKFNNEPIPKQMDLSPYFSEVKDQGNLGSCSAFPIAAIYEFAALKNKKEVSVSELFIYYNSRLLRGTTDVDSGASLLNAVKSVKEHGACLDASFPYLIEKFTEIPNENAYNEAKHQVVEKANRIKISEEDFKKAISEGMPVIFGLKLFESFYPKNEEGLISYPTVNESTHKNHGNHAMLIVGYNDDEKLFKVRNSWGSSFGKKGYCYIPYDYVTNEDFCNEAYVITEIVDLSYNEFNYDSKASFSFIKDDLIRKKNIYEYRIRSRSRELEKVRKKYDLVKDQNVVNAEQIKDSSFRKSVLNKIINTQNQNRLSPTAKINKNEIKNTDKNKWYLATIACLLFAGISVVFLGPISNSLGLLVVLCSFLIGAFCIYNILKRKKQTVDNLNISNHESTTSGINQSKLTYEFRVADYLFNYFDFLDSGLRTKYKAISRYYALVTKWKEESINNVNMASFKSPSFVFNVISKQPLLNYLSSEKDNYLTRMPSLSNQFHGSYDIQRNNDDLVFDELKSNYERKIKSNIDEVIDISLIDYLTGKEYPFFDPCPVLDSLMPKLEKASRPFCNLKDIDCKIDIQHYCLFEKIEYKKEEKLSEIRKHVGANIAPVIDERNDNRKKYVSIQITTIGGASNLVKS